MKGRGGLVFILGIFIGGVAILWFLSPQKRQTENSPTSASANYSLEFWFRGRNIIMDNLPRGRPDLFAVIEIAGQGTYVIPAIIQNYQGEFHVLNFQCPERIRPGTTVAIHFYADHSVSDAIWKRILQTQVQINGVLKVMPSAKVGADIRVSTTLQLIGSNSASELVLSGPTNLRTVVVTWPYFGNAASYKYSDTTYGAVTLKEM
ncbi:MAG: hypothetical protein FJ395_21875 [Verrucomicrobia bacterium]|nr:hypothetical protein [Verrucomicrobiota bacterium]